MMRKAADELRQEILSAFADVPKPPLDALAPHRCCECGELAAALHPHAAAAVPGEVLRRHVWDLPLLSDEGKQYYLPAWLLSEVENPSSDAIDAVVYALDTDHRWSPAVPYTLDQWLALDHWLAYISNGLDARMQEDVDRVRGKLPR